MHSEREDTMEGITDHIADHWFVYFVKWDS